MHHSALQHSAWHGICIGLMRLFGMNLAGVGGSGGASGVVLKQHKRTYRVPAYH
jgi:hypothetical protein